MQIEAPGMPAQGIPSMVRLVLCGPPKPDAAQQILKQALKQWPKQDQPANLTMLPGAFIEMAWPKTKVKHKTQPQVITAAQVAQWIQPVLDKLLPPSLLSALAQKTRLLSLGVDILTEQGIKGPHMELVALVDCTTKKLVGLTGKSYPTKTQEKQLIPIPQPESHTITLNTQDPMLLLGCNDLNVFNPRVQALTKPDSFRGKLSGKLAKVFKDFGPRWVVQTPHATDTPNIWRNAWMTLSRQVPNLSTWASAIRYYHPSKAPRATLADVLRLTKHPTAPIVDLIIDTTPFKSRPSQYFQANMEGF